MAQCQPLCFLIFEFLTFGTISFSCQIYLNIRKKFKLYLCLHFLLSALSTYLQSDSNSSRLTFMNSTKFCFSEDGLPKEINKQHLLVRMWGKRYPTTLLMGVQISIATIEVSMQTAQGTESSSTI